MFRNFKLIPAIILVVLLGACGGGNEDAGSASTEGVTRMLPTFWTPEGRYFNSCNLSPGCSGNPYAPYRATISAAPPEGAVLSGMVRLEVHGYQMANVELLPASGYLPRLGVFNITGDTTIAWMNFDTTKLPNGPIQARISAFNVPAGQPGGTEIVAMQTRTWIINNTSLPTTAFSAGVTTAPANGAVISGSTRLEVCGSGIANAELLPVSGYTPVLGKFNVSADRTLAWLDFDSRSLPDGVRDVRISAYSVTDGQPNGAEIVAMPSRRWEIRNGAAPPSFTPFSASVTMAPPHGAIVSGVITLEVRGTGIENVELLPAAGYTPRLGTFDLLLRRGEFASLYLDTKTLPNGPLQVRISAFNVPSGQQGGAEIIAMPVRQWEVRN